MTGENASLNNTNKPSSTGTNNHSRLHTVYQQLIFIFGYILRGQCCNDKPSHHINDTQHGHKKFYP